MIRLVGMHYISSCRESKAHGVHAMYDGLIEVDNQITSHSSWI